MTRTTAHAGKESKRIFEGDKLTRLGAGDLGLGDSSERMSSTQHEEMAPFLCHD